MSAFKSYFYAKPAQTTLKQNTTVLVDSAPSSPPPERAHNWSWRRPSSWGKKTYAAIALLIAAIIVAIVVPVVEVKKASPKYPDYYKINYKLQETWSGESFFNNFNYFDAPDPTHGFVTYVAEGMAEAKNLTHATSRTATIRVDANGNATSGRDSIRLVSKNAYNGGLFTFDVAHVPYGCGTWPAIWMTALNGWPDTGEIDIMETVNQGGPSQMTLHTSQGCSMGGQRNQTGTTVSTDCYVGSDFSASCAVMGSANSGGEAFNAIGGGVYAMEWRSEGIRMWFFERSKIPADIASPDPSTWPAPAADFPNTNCNIGSHFTDLHIVTNIALCGVWAGASDVYNGEDHCPGSCSSYVATNASAFEQAYFTYNSFQIFAPS